MNWINLRADIWAGTSRVIGACNICGAHAGGVVRWEYSGPLLFYCERHYRDILEGRTEWWELERLIREAV